MYSTDDRTELRKFGIVLGLALSAIGVIMSIKGSNLRFYLFAAAGIILLMAVVAPRYLAVVYRIWMTIGHVLGRVNSFLLLSIMYFFVLTPIGIGMRILGKQAQKFKYRQEKESLWIKRQPSDAREEMSRTF